MCPDAGSNTLTKCTSASGQHLLPIHTIGDKCMIAGGLSAGIPTITRMGFQVPLLKYAVVRHARCPLIQSL